MIERAEQSISPDVENIVNALGIWPEGENKVRAEFNPEFSNAPLAFDPSQGAPFGGLITALAVRSARKILRIEAPLRSITVQFLTAARFSSMFWQAKRLRGGRAISYVTIEGVQGSRSIAQALAVFAVDGVGPSLTLPPSAPLANPEHLPESTGEADIFPWFHRKVEYRFENGLGLSGQNVEARPVLRVWMRLREVAPVDEARLCMLLDAVYPTFWTAIEPPRQFAVTTHLTYDFLKTITPLTAPDGWVFFEFRTVGLGGGWAIEDAIACDRAGVPLALARQRRKLIPPDSPW